MNEWEYRTIQVPYDKKEHKNWVLKQKEKPPIVGLQAILEAFGVQGWELVSMEPEQFGVYPEFGKWYAQPAVYRATFKRQVEKG
jgi:hypothetical protein